MRHCLRTILIALLVPAWAGGEAQPTNSLPTDSIGSATPSVPRRSKEFELFKKGIQMETRGAHQLAAQAYREILSASPEHIEARYRLAMALRAMDPKSAEAIDHLQFCVSKQPANMGYRMELAAALENAGLTVDAAKEYDVLHRLLPGDPRLTYRLAQLYWAQQNGARAGQLLDELILRYPRQQGPLLLRAQILQKEGKPQEARALLDRTLAADPTNYTALVERAKANAVVGDGTAALADLGTAVRSNPTNPEGYRLLAQARMMQGDREGARQAEQMADTFDRLPKEQAQKLTQLYQKPRRTPAEDLYLGSQFAALGRQDLAAPLLEEGLKRNPRDQASWHLLGKIRYENEDYKGAAEAFKSSEQYMRRRDRLGFYRYMSTALLNSGDAAEAERCVEEGLRRHPKDKILLEVQAKARQAREPQKVPTMTSVQRNRLQQMERRQRWLEEQKKKGRD